MVANHGYLQGQFYIAGTDILDTKASKKIMKYLPFLCNEGYEYLKFLVHHGCGHFWRLPGGGRPEAIETLHMEFIVKLWRKRFTLMKELQGTDMLAIA